MTDKQSQRIHDIIYSNDSRTELAERIVALEDENARLRELLQRTWDIFHSATAREFNDTKSELRELGIEVDE